VCGQTSAMRTSILSEHEPERTRAVYFLSRMGTNRRRGDERGKYASLVEVLGE